MEKDPIAIPAKKFLYVTVYEELYKRIMNNEFPEGSLLPAENKLAELLNTSRVTLRQSLSLLHEDGLIVSVKGRGHMVVKPKKNMLDGLEKIAHPIYQCCSQTLDDVKMDCDLGLPTEYVKSIFKQKSSAVMAVDRWYSHGETLCAYSLSFIPVESATRLGVDISDKSTLLTFLEKTAYETAVSSTIQIKPATASDFVTKRYKLPKDGVALLMSENLYFGEAYPDVYNKHYFLASDYQVNINRSK